VKGARKKDMYKKAAEREGARKKDVYVVVEVEN
jgi:hypothetical protein